MIIIRLFKPFLFSVVCGNVRIYFNVEDKMIYSYEVLRSEKIIRAKYLRDYDLIFLPKQFPTNLIILKSNDMK